MSTKDKKAGSTASFHEQLGKEAEVPLASDEPEAENPIPEKLDYPSHGELEKQLTDAEAKAAQYWERLLRQQADMDNLQRRVERDIANAHKYALEKFALELLPVIDNLERAIAAHLNDESGAGSLLDGVELTLKSFLVALDKFGVKQFSPEGEPFNPELHQAVSMQADPSVKPGTVINVLQKGFLLNERLLRPAMVVVSKA